MQQSFLLAICVCVVSVLPVNAEVVLTVNGIDAAKEPVEIDGNGKLLIVVEGKTDKEVDYSVKAEMGCKIVLIAEQISSAENQQAYYLFNFEEQDGLGVVNLYADGEHIYELVLFYILETNKTIGFGIGYEDLHYVPDVPAVEESEIIEEPEVVEVALETETTSDPVEPVTVSSDAITAGYDLTLTGIHQYETAVSYSDKTILVADDGFVVYDSNALFDNCIVDVNGLVEFNSDIILTDSVIRVKGGLKIRPGATVTETGASSIIATGDSQNTGKISIEGELNNRITVHSDYIQNDAEFIIADANSCSNSSLKCIDFYGGWCNIWIRDKRLNEAISNCCFMGAKYAIWQDGPDELTDIRFSLFYQNYISMYLGIDGTYGVGVELLVDNVVVDNQYGDYSCGLVLSGLQSPSDFSSLRLTNSIITNCWCGWYIDNESFYPPIMSNIAYYGNYYDDNLSDSSFQQNAMYLAQNPFEEPESPNGWPYFIRQDSPVAAVDIGYDLWQSAPQQLVTTLYKNSAPRENEGIGFGVPISPEYYSNVYPAESDFGNDGIVNNTDFGIFSEEWGTVRGSPSNPVHYPDPNGYSIADFDHSGIVDIVDMAAFTDDWLYIGGVNMIVDSNETLLTVTCQHLQGLEISDYAIFLDGRYTASRDPDNNPTLIIDKTRHSKGNHALRAVFRTTDDRWYVTMNQPVSFDCPLHDVSFAELFDPANDYFIRGKLDEGYSAVITVKDIEEQVLWSNSYSSDFIAAVDTDTFSEGQVNYQISYSYQPDVLAMSFPVLGTFFISALDGPPSYQTAGLVICMEADGMKNGVNELDTGTARFAARMMKQRSVFPIVLHGYGENNQVNYDTFKKIFNKYRRVRYGHIYAHGNYVCKGAGIFGGNVPRTRVEFNDGPWPVFNSKKWTLRGQPVPAGYEYLSKKLEKANTLWHLNFEPGQIRILVIESCRALRNVATMDGSGLVTYIPGAYEYELAHYLNYHPAYPYSDICFGLNILNTNQMTLGSAALVLKGELYHHYSTFFNTFWERLSVGHNAYNALEAARENATHDDVCKYFRTRGSGIQAEIYLTSNPY